jgi:glycosyltransferase involved in cell wall biosynthesis
MFHEDFVPPSSWKFRVMRVWQRWQFRSLGQAAHLVFFSIDPWVKQYRDWFKGKPVLHLPVGSNILQSSLTREQARQRLGIADHQLVIGLFGSGHSALMLDRVAQAAHRVREQETNAVLLYVGTNGAVVRKKVTALPVRDEGPLPGEQVSQRLAAMDLYLSPFADGVSTRRGSLHAGLQHALPIVGTCGPLTDQILRDEADRSLLLAPVDSQQAFVDQVLRLATDAALRSRLGEAARQLCEREFTWARIAQRMITAMQTVSTSPQAEAAVARDAVVLAGM